jgi:uncharacterized protein YndB with AHSA1/START domain
MTNFVEAKVNHRFKAAAERVFDAWLDPASVRAWLAIPDEGKRDFDVRRVEIDARVGGRFTFSDMREDGEAVHWGEYEVIDRPHRLVFTWFVTEEEEEEGTSQVTLTLEPLPDGGCQATIVHRMDAQWAEWVGRTAEGWGTMLAKIGRLVG